jgi:hypothetical protein
MPGRRGRALVFALSAMLVVALAGPAAAHAVVEDFETPLLSDGTQVSTQFQANGVYFTAAPGDGISLPEIDDDAPARSGTRTLDITTGAVGEEFPHPGVEGRFTNVVTDVTVYVRNLFSVPATLSLDAYRSGGGLVSDSESVAPGAWVALSAAAGAGASFHRFQVNAADGVDSGKEIRVDDVEFTVDAGALPDYQLVTEDFGGVALPGQPKQYEIEIQRLNGFSGSVSFSGGVLGTFGETVSFSPSSTAGSSTTVTMTLPASKGAGVDTLRITGSSSLPDARTLDIDFTIESPYSVQFTPPLPLRPDRCATTPFELRIVRNRFFDAPVQLDVEHQNPAGSIPPDLDIAFDRATIPSGSTVSLASLNVTRGDHPESPAPVPLQIVATAGGVKRVLPFEILRASPRLTSVSPLTLFAPQAMLGGSGLTVRGNGLCPGALIQFGNDAARAPGSFATTPAPGDPTRVQLTATTPRLATSGPVAAINPSGAVASSAGVLPDTTVHSYRDRFGFSFPNEDGVWEDVNEDGTVNAADEPAPVGAGSLRDWQELVGPHQTNLNACEVGLFLPGCWEVITPIPTPQHGLMQTILGEASFYNRGGTCVGLAIASRRIAAGQATVGGRPPGAAGLPVWSLQRMGRETIRGRGDIPLESTAQYSPIKYGAILHPAQTTAEYIELWVQRRTINAVSGPDIMRRALEGHLRAGRRPLLNINWEGGGHAVNVYDIEDRPGGGYFIRVYDNNYPYQTAEQGNGALRTANDQNWSRIEVTPGGSWTAPGMLMRTGTDAAGKPIRGPRTGPTGDLSWIAVENELPVVPGSLASLDGWRALATPGLSSSISASASATRAVKSGVLELGYLDGEGSLTVADSDRAHSIGVRPDGKGKTRVGIFGEGSAAEVLARGGGAGASAKGGGNRVLLPKGSAEGIGFKAGSGAARVDLTLISDKAGRLARVGGARGGVTEVKLIGKNDKVRLTHKGRPGPVKIELAAFGRRDSAARLTTTLRLGAGAKVTLLPRWKRLGGGVVAIVNGKRQVLRNRVKPPVLVKRVRVGAKQRGKQAVARVRARLVGKLGKLDALVVGVQVSKGKKIVGRAFRQLPPNRRSIRRLAKGIRLGAKLKSRRGRLRVRAVVSAVAADPLPSGSSKLKTTRLR